MRSQRLVPLCCGTKGSCPGQTFDPGSNILLPIIARSDDVDGSKYKHAHFIPGWGHNVRVFFNKQAKNTMATNTEQTRLKVPKNQRRPFIGDKMFSFRYASGTLQPASSSTLSGGVCFAVPQRHSWGYWFCAVTLESKYYNDYQIQLNYHTISVRRLRRLWWRGSPSSEEAKDE